MTAKSFLVCVLFTMSSPCLVTRSASAQVVPEPSKARLEERVSSYYRVLQKLDFVGLWGFFDDTMKRDNPKDEYVTALQQAVKGVKLLSDPGTSIGPIKRGEFVYTVGRGETTLQITGEENSVSEVLHRTTWVWEKEQFENEFSWFLIRDSLSEIQR